METSDFLSLVENTLMTFRYSYTCVHSLSRHQAHLNSYELAEVEKANLPKHKVYCVA